MQNGLHRLAEEFPNFKDKIHEMKMDNRHFKRLFDEYEEIDREIYNSENNIKILSNEHEEELKKKRLKLKDELYGILSAA